MWEVITGEVVYCGAKEGVFKGVLGCATESAGGVLALQAARHVPTVECKSW